MGLGSDLASLLNPSHCNAQVIIVVESGLDEPFQRFIFENLPPRQIGKRSLLCCSFLAAKVGWNIDRRSLVVGTD